MPSSNVLVVVGSSEHYRTPPEWCARFASLDPPRGVALDPWAGRPDQVNYVRARHYLYRDRRKRLGGGGFTSEWAPLAEDGLIYSNPAYSRKLLALSMERIIEQAGLGLWNVALVPASSDTGWFHQALMSADHLMLVKRRIRFVDPAIVARLRARAHRHGKRFVLAPSGTRKRRKGDNTARFSNAVFHWAGEHDRTARLDRFERVMSPHGVVIRCEDIRAVMRSVLGEGAAEVARRFHDAASPALTAPERTVRDRALRALPGGR